MNVFLQIAAIAYVVASYKYPNQMVPLSLILCITSFFVGVYGVILPYPVILALILGAGVATIRFAICRRR